MRPQPVLKGEKFEGDIEVKRLYISGYELTAACPICGKSTREDIGGDSLSYPTLNEPHGIHMYCDNCGEGWSEPVVFEMTCRLP